MHWLNETNGADKIARLYHQKVLDEFPGEHVYGAVMGSAYGGEIEECAKLWQQRGTIYGFDTFEDLHPKHLAPDGNETSFEATCMDVWYSPHVFGTDELAIEYQRKELRRQGLTNAVLIKGEVHPLSCKDIPKLHYGFLDMDMPTSMDNGYKAMRDKIVEGGYLFFHDTKNIASVGAWFQQDVLEADKHMWEIEGEWNTEILVGLKRKPKGNEPGI